MKKLALRLDDRSGIPVYIQLREQLLHAIARGAALPGEQLPTVRQVAVELSINPNTVNRAYAELERQGVLETQRGRGTFVSESPSPNVRSRAAGLRELAERFVTQAQTMGFGAEEIARAVKMQNIQEKR